MPAITLKVLRVALEYGALLWLAYAVVRLGSMMFRTLRSDLKDAAAGTACRRSIPACCSGRGDCGPTISCGAGAFDRAERGQRYCPGG